jgi:hypothetical protein
MKVSCRFFCLTALAADETGQAGLGKDGKYFYYRLMVRGVMDLDIDFSGSEPKGGWNDWSIWI